MNFNLKMFFYYRYSTKSWVGFIVFFNVLDWHSFHKGTNKMSLFEYIHKKKSF